MLSTVTKPKTFGSPAHTRVSASSWRGGRAGVVAARRGCVRARAEEQAESAEKSKEQGGSEAAAQQPQNEAKASGGQDQGQGEAKQQKAEAKGKQQQGGQKKKKSNNPNDRGPFAPAVKVARFALGEKRLNSIRGKAIALHSQVISDFCKYVGAPAQVRQGLIKMAKNNGGKLGFLA